MSKIELGTNAFDYLGFDQQDLEDLINMADGNARWEAPAKFIAELLDRNQHELTFKQIDWANKIKDQLDDARRKGKL